MAKQLDFSTGPEDHISVRVEGWTAEEKSAFAAAVLKIDGVKNARSAGGGTSYYIDYDSEITNPDELSDAITAVRHAMFGGSATPSEHQEAEDQGQRLVTKGGDALVTENGDALVTEDGVVRNTEDAEVRIAEDRPQPRTQSDPAENTFNPSSWTGISSPKERIMGVRQMVPSAMSALEALIADAEKPGHNGGPPLVEKQEAIDALKNFHAALGELLAAAEAADSGWIDGKGMIASCAQFAQRASATVKNDPIPFAIIFMIGSMLHALGAPAIAGVASSVIWQFRKK